MASSSKVPTHTQVSRSAAVPADALPSPDAEYAELVRDPVLFFQKLYAFHASVLSTGLRIPTFGGTNLDLHRLFVEVTKRGGYDKVVAEHGWAELSKQVFGYQSTSSSHNLKKHYEMLLRDFEEVYYVRNGNSSLVTTGSGNVDGSSALQHVSGTPIMSLKPGSSINGVVEAKCPWGYHVTVEGGNEKVHEGFMYHVPEEEVTRAAAAVESQAGQESPTEDPLIIRPPDQYCYFYEEMKDKLKPLYGRHESDMNKKILLMWNRLSDTEKQGWRRR